MEEDKDSNHNIKVVCRIRPANSREQHGGWRQAVHAKESNIIVNTKPEPKSFTFDYAAGEGVAQEAIFQEVGVPVTKSCVEGYNGTILCYGQTGSGKTYTIFGPDTGSGVNGEDDEHSGLVPRVLDYIWDHLAEDEMNSEGTKSFSCRCSFYEIYQERVFDLLDSAVSCSERGLSVREDSKRGVYVENCTEEVVSSAIEAKDVLKLGYRNRHVGATSMNRESSRSHAVFQLMIDTTVTKNGVCSMKTSRFNMIDLAGSERQKDTNATGERLKEASQINKSLSALGNVINALAAMSNSGGRKHVHYRDSKLTFLLRDSLGGNSKTTLVGTLSPADASLAETLSTLQFCQRAKAIKNHAIVNEDTTGTMEALQNEILALKSQLSHFSSSNGNGNLTPSKISFSKHAPSESSPDKKGNHFTISRNEEILLDSLNRAKTAEEAALRSEITIRDLTKQLSQAENFSMSMKMKVKMRDSEIQRLKRKDSSAQQEHSSDEAAKVDIDAVKQELQAEVVKYKLASEELSRRLSLYEPQEQSTDGNDKLSRKDRSPFLLWNNTLEMNFQHDLLIKVSELEKKNKDLQEHITEMGKGMFLGYFGFSLEEAENLRDENAEAKARAEELSITCQATKLALDNALSKVSELDASLMKLRDEFECKKCEFECERLQLSATVSCLQDEVSDKSEEILNLKGNIKRSDDEMAKAQQEKEREIRDQYNKLMKENVILLQSNRDLESSIKNKNHALEKKTEELLCLEDKVTYVCNQMEIAGSKHKEAVNALQAKLGDAERIITSQNEKLESNATQLQAVSEEKNLVVNDAVELKKKVKDAEEKAFYAEEENQGHIETIDNLTSQTETLVSHLEEEKVKYEATQSKANSLKIELANASNANNNLQLELKKLESTMKEKEEEKKQLNATLSNTQQQLDKQTAELLEAKDDITELRMQVDDAVSGMERLKGQSMELEAANASYLAQMASLERSIASLRLDIDKKSTELHESNSLINVLKEEQMGLKESNEDLHTELMRAKEEVEEHCKQLEAKESELQISKTNEVTIKEELQQTEVTLSNKALLISSLEQEIKSQSENVNTITHELQNARDLLSEKTGLVSTLEQEKLEQSNANEALTQELQNARDLLREKTGLVSTLEQEKLEQSNANEALTQELQNARDLLREKTGLVSTLEQEKLEQSNANEALTQELQNARDLLREKTGLVSTLEQEKLEQSNANEALTQELNQLEEGMTICRSQLKDSSQQLEDLQASLEESKSKVEAAEQEKEQLTHQIQELKTSSYELNNALSESKCREQNLMKEATEKQSSIEENESVIESQKEELQILQEKIESTKASNESHQQRVSQLEDALIQLEADKDRIHRAQEERISQLQQSLEESCSFASSLSSQLETARLECSERLQELSESRGEVEKGRQAIESYDSLFEALEKIVTSWMKFGVCDCKQLKSLGSNKESLQMVEALEKLASQWGHNQRESQELKSSLEAVTSERDCLESKAKEADEWKERMDQEKESRLGVERNLASIQRKHAETSKIIAEKEKDLSTLRSASKESTRMISDLRNELMEVKNENSRLCGHQNNKQKIQLHMTLKKNIEEQAQSLKQMQDQLSKMTQERDHAVDELQRLKLLHPSENEGSKHATNKKVEKELAEMPQMVRRSQVKRKPLGDATASSDNRVQTRSSNTKHL